MPRLCGGHIDRALCEDAGAAVRSHGEATNCTKYVYNTDKGNILIELIIFLLIQTSPATIKRRGQT
jgi:hypothetical protein